MRWRRGCARGWATWRLSVPADPWPAGRQPLCGAFDAALGRTLALAADTDDNVYGTSRPTGFTPAVDPWRYYGEFPLHKAAILPPPDLSFVANDERTSACREYGGRDSFGFTDLSSVRPVKA